MNLAIELLDEVVGRDAGEHEAEQHAEQHHDQPRGSFHAAHRPTARGNAQIMWVKRSYGFVVNVSNCTMNGLAGFSARNTGIAASESALPAVIS